MDLGMEVVQEQYDTCPLDTLLWVVKISGFMTDVTLSFRGTPTRSATDFFAG